jgi:hypothetical protein
MAVDVAAIAVDPEDGVGDAAFGGLVEGIGEATVLESATHTVIACADGATFLPLPLLLLLDEAAAVVMAGGKRCKPTKKT